jgi:aerobic-type carbon monoxide dehydrogenase small subunit (CoxS/CutS family)
MSEHVDITVTVNGTVHRAGVEPRVHAADFLRNTLHLTGTHVGCEQGVCGMCTVLLDGEAVKSCLLLAAQLDGRSVQTVESLAEGEELSPLQQAFKDHHGLQCGFCTPGFLMAATALAGEGGEVPTRDEIREGLSGVLCRCTGYEGIVDAVEQHLTENARG